MEAKIGGVGGVEGEQIEKWRAPLSVSQHNEMTL